MSKIEKKRKKLEERIELLEEEMRTNLRQKISSTAEISISKYQQKILKLRRELIEINLKTMKD